MSKHHWLVLTWLIATTASYALPRSFPEGPYEGNGLVTLVPNEDGGEDMVYLEGYVIAKGAMTYSTALSKSDRGSRVTAPNSQIEEALRNLAEANRGVGTSADHPGSRPKGIEAQIRGVVIDGLLVVDGLRRFEGDGYGPGVGRLATDQSNPDVRTATLLEGAKQICEVADFYWTQGDVGRAKATSLYEAVSKVLHEARDSAEGNSQQVVRNLLRGIQDRIFNSQAP